jgi:glycerophosphoryl diester phosphodiesterase
VKKSRYALVAIAVVAVALSLLNASWLAPKPTGKLVLVAHRGLAQQFPRDGITNETCTATRIRAPEHNFIENTLYSMDNAVRYGAGAIELDVHPTTDGKMVVFHDWTLECRTNDKGVVREHSLAELKSLDVGYGYTADGGRTFPLRGRGVGGMPSVEEVLTRFPRTQFFFHFKSKDARDADLLVAAFGRAGVPIDGRFAFYGDEAVTGRMQLLAPDAWVFSNQQVKACGKDYVKWGWSGIVPQSCRNGTIIFPLNYRWLAWGWPNRFLDRMTKAGTKVILFGDYRDGVAAGIENVEQLEKVPRDFRGYLWIEDFYTVGRALQQ